MWFFGEKMWKKEQNRAIKCSFSVKKTKKLSKNHQFSVKRRQKWKSAGEFTRTFFSHFHQIGEFRKSFHLNNFYSSTQKVSPQPFFRFLTCALFQKMPLWKQCTHEYGQCATRNEVYRKTMINFREFRGRVFVLHTTQAKPLICETSEP